MLVSELDYDLPEELIAEKPVEKRDQSRLLRLKSHGAVESLKFADILGILNEGDLLILNDTRVFQAAIGAERVSGGKFEVLFNEKLSEDGEAEKWIAMTNHAKRLKDGETIILKGGLEAQIEESKGEGFFAFRFEPGVKLVDYLQKHGSVPLPPYIRKQSRSVEPSFDRERYQTVFARAVGSAAAPTAGLHFTPELLASLERKGVALAYVTLHVGAGTFLPLRNERLEENRLHSERFELTEKTALAINETKRKGGRIVAVGTTAVRTLETCADTSGIVKAAGGKTDIFIAPGYKFKTVEAIITNFHLPRSSLLALVCAFAGKEKIMAAYAEAIKLKYRFYSYGDAMFIEP